MKNITARLNKALIWQAMNFQNQLKITRRQTASAFHDVRNLINHIENPPQSLIFLLNEILNRAKYENKVSKTHNESFSINEMLLDLEKIFTSTLSKKNLKLILDFDIINDLSIYSDKAKLLQILTNLIGNACKFTERGFIKITARPSKTVGKIYFAVSDSGIGIEPENLNLIFKEFSQIHNVTSSNKIAGTGLGLPICNGLVAALGGNLEVKSTIGEGSQFHFEIPSQTSSSLTSSIVDFPTLNASKTQLFSKNESRAQLFSNRILLIEDDLAICELVHKFFEERNITCDFTHQNTTAINLCSYLPKNYYSLIITDMHLKDSDGLSGAKVYKKVLDIPCPIVLLSASNKNSNDKYFDDFIKKPAHISSLEEIVNKYIKYEFAFDAPSTLDTSSTLKTILDKHKARFKINYKDSSNKFNALFEADDFYEIRNYSHSIKGLTSTLGYNKLASSSGIIEELVLKIIEHNNNFSTNDKNKLSLAIENYNKALLDIYFL